MSTRQTSTETCTLTTLERQLLNDFQHRVPLTPTPFADIAAELGVTEQEVLDTLRVLSERGAVSRVGPVFRPNRLGVSTLAALAVAPDRLEDVAALVSGYAEVNHNYEREHRFNLWFVVTASGVERLEAVLGEIEARTGLTPLYLPLLADSHIDLGFDLQWT